MIRAFIAVELEAQTVQEIADAVARLKPLVPGVRWVTETNFHLTLKFLGEIDDDKVEPIAQALETQLYLFSSFTINAKGLGVFPDLKRPRILWVGLVGVELNALAANVEKALTPLGFEPEKRAFTGHLTIGRWRQFGGSPKSLGEAIEEWKGHDFGRSKVDRVVLFQSVLKPEGAVYRPLKTIALMNRALLP